MKVSIALCTYNGENFLEEQLSSIGQQIRLPDELIISDDDSTDSTVQIAEKFAAIAPFSVKISINSKRLGSTKNFEMAISQCSGDIIFLSDQDDFWNPDKINLMGRALEESNTLGCIFSNGEVVDENLDSLNKTLWQGVNFNCNKQYLFSHGRTIQVLVQQNVMTGATMAFKSVYKSILLPIPEGWIHDAWIALILAIITETLPCDMSLIEYRQHSNQQIGIRDQSIIDRYLKAKQNNRSVYEHEIELFNLVLMRLSALQLNDSQRLKSNIVINKIKHLERRCKMADHIYWRLSLPFIELITLRYNRYSFGLDSFLKDLIIGTKK